MALSPIGDHYVVSEELFAPVRNDVEICYQTFGDPEADPILLIMGLGGPMIWWDEDFCTQLAAAGFFVIRYDNRDTGRSSRMNGRPRRDHVVRAYAGNRVRPPYAISDMASDAADLLDHLGIPAAHIAGVSMGGMIAQTVAVEHPTRVLSLTSIMSTTGRRSVGWQDPRLLPVAMGRRMSGREAYIAQSSIMWTAIGSPGYPTSPDTLAARAADTFDRGVSASGVTRQIMAILTQPDRTKRLRSLRVPTLVIHGNDDKMVHVSGGRATAAAVPGAELVIVDGMGHDLPPSLFTGFIEAIRRTADRAAVGN